MSSRPAGCLLSQQHHTTRCCVFGHNTNQTHLSLCEDDHYFSLSLSLSLSHIIIFSSSYIITNSTPLNDKKEQMWKKLFCAEEERTLPHIRLKRWCLILLLCTQFFGK